MIYKTLNILTKKLEGYISNKFNLDEKILTLSSPANPDVMTNTFILNKLLITLVNIERETSMGINFKSKKINTSHLYHGRPPLSINLFVLISANFAEKNYDESLKYISSALEFFQTNDLLTKFNTPELDPSIVKLHLELVNLSFQELSNLWSIFGSKYLPSFLLKIRMLTLDNEEIESVEKAAGKTQIDVKYE